MIEGNSPVIEQAKEQFRELAEFGNKWEDEKPDSREEGISLRKRQVNEIHRMKKDALKLNLPGKDTKKIMKECEDMIPGSGAYVEYKILVLFYREMLELR